MKLLLISLAPEAMVMLALDRFVFVLLARISVPDAIDIGPTKFKVLLVKVSTPAPDLVRPPLPLMG